MNQNQGTQLVIVRNATEVEQLASCAKTVKTLELSMKLPPPALPIARPNPRQRTKPVTAQTAIEAEQWATFVMCATNIFKLPLRALNFSKSISNESNSKSKTDI